MMKLRKGSKVEVLSKQEVPSGSWWCGVIVYGNGHTFDIKYDRTADDMDDKIVERVSRKFIRPCPPTIGGERKWVAGDIAEVFDNHTWKIAVILKVVGEDYVVRFVGYPGELRVHKSDLRVRLSWKDYQWEVIGKDSGSCNDRVAKKLLLVQSCSKPSCKVMKVRTGGKQLQGFENQNGQAKRSRFCSSDAEALAGGVGQKIRIIEKDGRCQRLTVALPSPFLEKVDAVASPKSILGDNFVHASSRTRVTGFTEMDMVRIPTSIEPGDSESSTNPVASCSANDWSSSSPNGLTTYPNQDLDCHSDAESSSGNEYGCKRSIFRNKDMASELHKLELHAYRSTMEALFASGPLSWEQEAMVTNLRLMLHISNDEHLFELRHLVSAES